MEMTDMLDVLHSAARSVGAEVTSPWFYLQLGIVTAGAGIAFAAGAAIRAHTDMSTVARGWPAPLRMMLRVLIAYSSTAVFAVLMRVARADVSIYSPHTAFDNCAGGINGATSAHSSLVRSLGYLNRLRS